jgi:hypothetical protein
MELEWLEGFSAEYMVDTIQLMKQELLRRGLDECGHPYTRLPASFDGLRAKHLSPVDAERERLIHETISLVPVPLRSHHDCLCDKSQPFHDLSCPVGERIRAAAEKDPIALEDVNEVLIRVRGKVEVETQ